MVVLEVTEVLCVLITLLLWSDQILYMGLGYGIAFEMLDSSAAQLACDRGCTAQHAWLSGKSGRGQGKLSAWF